MIDRLARACARRHRRAFALALAALALAAAPVPATVYTSFDFETPSYGAAGRRLSDHQLLKAGGTWHLFYTELADAFTPVDRIGHAVSTDLVHWSERPTAIAAGSTSWTLGGTWSPQVIASPAGGWIMLFTGENGLGSEAIGALFSGDLDTWQLVAGNPVFTPSTSWARWAPDVYCPCRDPFVYLENGVYTMLFTAETASPKRAALGHAWSADLLHWTDLGPCAIDSVSSNVIALESSSLVFGAGRVELHFTRSFAQMLIAPSASGPWDFAQAVDVDDKGGASEIAVDGSVRILSRVRYDLCRPGTQMIVIDTVTTTPTGYRLPLLPTLSAAWLLDGDAFTAQPTYGDGPMLRGDTPAQPDGLRWLASGETLRQPGESPLCDSPPVGARTGSARSPRFTLLGDLLSFRLSGVSEGADLRVALVDDCTGQELARTLAPGTSALTPFSWSNAGRRGWPVRLVLTDSSSTPDGVIGLDAVRDSAAGSPAAPVPPLVDETAPAGGENLAPGSTYTIRYTGSSAAGLDSFVVYLSYDDFATPPTRLAKRNANQATFNWTVPPGPKFNAKVRVVAYAKNGVHACDQGNAFAIAAAVGVDEDPPASGLALAARGQPGPSPVLEWSAPPGLRAMLTLHDARGRLVRRLYEGAGQARARAAWDGLDDGGRRMPRGIYFARLVSGGAQATARLVRL